MDRCVVQNCQGAGFVQLQIADLPKTPTGRLGTDGFLYACNPHAEQLMKGELPKERIIPNA